MVLVVDTLVGFDSETRALVRGGLRRNCNSSIGAIAGPGTVYVVGPGDAYEGVYRFDTVTVGGRATLVFDDEPDVGVFDVEPGLTVIDNSP